VSRRSDVTGQRVVCRPASRLGVAGLHAGRYSSGVFAPTDLLTLSPAQVRDSAAILQQQAKRLFAMADAMEAADASSADVRRDTSRVVAESGSPAATDDRPVAPSSKRPTILAILRDKGDPVSPTDVHRSLVARGEVDANADASTTRMTLRRMAKKNEIVRVADGYVLPDAHGGKPQASFDEPGDQ